MKFAQYFGLKPPCLWCSRVDHIFNHGKDQNFHRDLLCESHAREISQLGFCSNHQKLASSQDMCEDCLSSRPEFQKVSKSFTFFGMIQTDDDKVVENGHLSLNCSCCGVCLDSKMLPQIVIKPSFDVLEFSQKAKFITDENRSNKNEIEMVSEINGDFDGLVSEVQKLGSVLEEKNEEIVEERQEKMMKDQAIQVSVEEHIEFFIDCSGHQLVPVELIDSDTGEKENRSREMSKVGDQSNNDSGIAARVEGKTEVSSEGICRGVVKDEEHTLDESKFGGFDYMEIEEDENSLVFYAKGCLENEVNITQVAQTPSQEAAEDDEKLSDFHPADEDNAQTPINETEAEVSIGTEIPDLDVEDEIQTRESHSSINAADNQDVVPVQSYTFELNSLSVEANEHLNEIEEDKVPDTPNSMDSINLHKKLLMPEKKDSGTEDSLDGSVTSELDGADGVLTIEGLKTALRNERKSLNALYTELEEERNASAIAANQTMAMINRLQEEKAAMQMEALQYQRMMEEQAEYDQEALQLLNELMVKREKEKEELEKELEIYKKKVLEYETKEKLRKFKESNGRSGFSSPSCSNAEESDAASIDLNQEAKDDDGFYSHRESDHDNTPINAVLNLEESIADFEEERLSILEQLKALEEKLMTLDDDDEEVQQHFEDVRSIEHYQENGNNHTEENGHFDGLANGHSNGFQTRRLKGAMGKSLLPLFDATSIENGEDVLINGGAKEDESNGVLHNDIEDELDHVYERLQALEADREFLKHCISSLNKGDKGMHLLHEILQHLKDLRNVELRVKNLNDASV